MTPVAIHRGMARDSFAVVAVTPGATRSAGTHQARRPGRERPPSPRAWYGFGRRCVFTRQSPPSRGRSRSRYPLREGREVTAMLRLSTLVLVGNDATAAAIAKGESEAASELRDQVEAIERR